MEHQKYLEQEKLWPQTGKHILAHYDDEYISVYQAYNPAIADYAVKHQKFGDNFSYNRMSWIKPNFLWMMFRAGWATKTGQERILQIRMRRKFFDEILEKAVVSAFDPARFSSKEEWDQKLETSEVRLQWDPDHDPHGKPLVRKAIQLGLRGSMLARYGKEEIALLSDVTDFVSKQRNILESDATALLTPVERVYVPGDAAFKNIGLDAKL